MTSRITRVVLSSALALSFGLASVPLGCGSTEGGGRRSRPCHEMLPEVPKDIERRLGDCVRQASAPFPPAEGNTYAIDFNVHVSKNGSVHAVEIKESTLGGHGVETCFARVLEGTTLPVRSIRMGLEDWAPRHAVAPSSRALFGQPVLAAANPASLMPVVIAAAAVIVVVSVIVYVTSEPATSTTTVAPPVVTAIPAASAMPTTTAVPMTTAVPIATVVPRDPALERYCLKLQEECLETSEYPEGIRGNPTVQALS